MELLPDSPKNARKSISIFLASPGDVWRERAYVDDIFSLLRDEWNERVHLTLFRWEDQPMTAERNFPDQIPSPAGFDVVVILLWTTLGTPLARAEGEPEVCGTQYELEIALEAAEREDGPKVLIYRKMLPPSFSELDPVMLQRRADSYARLCGYIDEQCGSELTTFSRAFREFRGPEQFREMFQTHLSKIVEDTVSTRRELRRSWKTCPYPGLQAFEAGQRSVFKGRSKEKMEVVERLRSRGTDGMRFVAVAGMSGAGKSSLAHAGVRQMMTSAGLVPGVSGWRVATCRPSDGNYGLVHGMLDALGHGDALGPEFLAGKDRERFASAAGRSTELLASELNASLVRFDEAREQDNDGIVRRTALLLIVDQMEELLAAEASEQFRWFAELLHVLATESGGPVWILCTVRSDLRANLLEDMRLRKLMGGTGTFELLPPDPDQLRQMIAGPALAAGATFEVRGGVALNARILDDALKASLPLPLLQFALQELWRRDVGDGQSNPDVELVLTWRGYESLGAVAGQGSGNPLERALAVHAESCLEEIPRAIAAELDRVLFHLLRHDSGRTLRARAPWSTIEALGSDARALAVALEKARLLTIDEAGVQLSHEGLVTGWDRLLVFATAHRDLLELAERVGRDAELWRDARAAQGGGATDLLLPAGLRLEQGRALLEIHPSLEAGVEEFIYASIAEEATRRRQARRARNRGLRRAVAGLTALLVMTVLSGYLLHRNRKTTEDQRLARRDGTVALALAEDSPLARRQLLDGLAGSGISPELIQAQQVALAEPVPVLELAHFGGVARSVAHSPVHNWVAALWSDGVLALVQVDDRGRRRSPVRWLTPAQSGLDACASIESFDGLSVRWDRSGTMLLVQVGGRTAARIACDQMPGAAIGAQVAQAVEVAFGLPMTASTRLDEDFDFSSSLSWAVETSGEGPPRLYGLRSSDVESVNANLKRRLEEVRWPDGRGPNDILWAEFSEDERSVALAIDEDWLGSLELDGESRMVSWRDLNGTGFSPVTVLRTGSGKAAVAVLEREVMLLADPAGSASRAETQDEPDAVSLHASWAEAHDLRRPVLTSAAGSSELDRVFVSDDDGWVHVLDTRVQQQLARFRAHRGKVQRLAAPPDGAWFTTAGSDGRLRVWSGLGASNPVVLSPVSPIAQGETLDRSSDQRAPEDITFSPCGRWLARSTDSGNQSWLWRVCIEEGGPLLTVAHGFEARNTTKFAFDERGEWMCTLDGSLDSKMTLWRIDADGNAAYLVRIHEPASDGIDGAVFAGGCLHVAAAGGIHTLPLEPLSRGVVPQWSESPAPRGGQVTLSACGHAAASLGRDGSFAWWTMEDGWCALELPQDLQPWPHELLVDAAGYAVVFYGYDSDLSDRPVPPVEVLSVDEGRVQLQRLGGSLAKNAIEGRQALATVLSDGQAFGFVDKTGHFSRWSRGASGRWESNPGPRPLDDVVDARVAGRSLVLQCSDGTTVVEALDAGTSFEVAPLRKPANSGHRACFDPNTGLVARAGTYLSLRLDRTGASWAATEIRESLRDAAPVHFPETGGAP